MSKLSELAELLKSAKKKPEPIVEAVVEPVAVTTTEPEPASINEQAEAEAEALAALQEARVVQPQLIPTVSNTDLADEKLAAIRKELALLKRMMETTARNNQMASYSGGGAGEIYNLDMPSKVVSSDYAVQRYDYYIGVNANTQINITLPASAKPGRPLVIKDESGHAQATPIRILGTIDNDVNGALLRINNGAVQLFFRNGWRII